MATRRREKMSAVDTAWLRMDRPDNLMMICGVLLLRDRIKYERLFRVVEDRFLRYHRFRQRPVEARGAVWWETDEDFDLANHVTRVRLPGKAGQAELQALVSRLVSRPLDPVHPLWQFHVVENFDEGSALIARIHHCYADGIALTQVLLSMTDAKRRAAAVKPREVKTALAGRNGDDGDSALMQALPDPLKMAMKVGGVLIRKGVAIWQDPAEALALANQGTAVATEIAKLALMTQDSPTRFKGTPGVVKRAAWTDPIALPEVKSVGRAFEASVNDVLLSSVAGALREYLVRKGDAVEGVVIRALVPVNLRPQGKAHELGNQFGLVFLDLPIGIADPVERLRAVSANMNALKASYQPVLALGLLAAMGAGPKLLQDQILAALARNATAVMTNVPGPQQTLYIAGAHIDSLMVWVPQSGEIGLGVSVISYDGLVQFGVLTDRNFCPDPARIAARFAPEFEKLRALGGEPAASA
jgi:WS/DGAT/MGAT family acyltransferase